MEFEDIDVDEVIPALVCPVLICFQLVIIVSCTLGLTSCHPTFHLKAVLSECDPGTPWNVPEVVSDPRAAPNDEAVRRAGGLPLTVGDKDVFMRAWTCVPHATDHSPRMCHVRACSPTFLLSEVVSE